MSNGLGLVGEITLKKYRDNNFDEPVDIICAENVVTERAVNDIFNYRGPFNSTLKIALSTSSLAEDYNLQTLNNIIAIGSTPAGIPGYTYTEKTSEYPRYVEYIYRFNFVGSARTFRTIGLVTGTSGDVFNNISQPCWAYKTLPIQVTQQANETIDIYYRVRFDWSLATGKLLNAYREAIELATLGRVANLGTSTFTNYGCVLYCPVRIPKNTQHRDLWAKYETIAFTWMTSSGLGNPTSSGVASNQFSSARYPNANLLKQEFIAKAVRISEIAVPPNTTYRNDGNDVQINFTGRVFASALYGSSGITYGERNKPFYYGDIKNTREPFQNIFSHASDAQTLFYDNQKLSNSSWKPIIEGTWNRKFPKLINLRVATAGGVGAGAYLFKIMPYTEVHKNFQSSFIVLPWKGGADLRQFHYYRTKTLNFDRNERRHQLYNHDCVLIPITQEKILTANEIGFTILDLATGEFTNYNSSTTPALPCQNITQIAYNKVWNSNVFYIADRVEGLFKFQLDTNTITRLSTEICFGVDIKDDGTVLALLDRKIKVSSNDFSSSTVFEIPTINIENWNRINFIKVEKNIFSSHKAILCGKDPFGSTTNYHTRDVLHWWNSVNGLVQTRSTSTSIIGQPAAVNGVADFIQGGHATSRPTSIEWNRTHQVWIYKSTRNRVGYTGSSYYLTDRYAIASATLSAVTESASVYIIDFLFHIGFGSDRADQTGFNLSTILLNENDELIIPHGIYAVNATKNGFTAVTTRNPPGTTTSNSSAFFDYVYPGSFESDVCYLGQGLVFANWSLIYMYRYDEEPNFKIGVVKSWNGTTSTFENNATSTPKTLHTETIPLDEGLTIRWQDLSPTNTQDLIVNQFYTQTIANGVVCDGYEGNIPFNFFYSLRPTQEPNLNIVLDSSGLFYVPGAPLSSTPDSLFWSLEDTETYAYKLKLDGVDVANILPPGAGTPASGQIKIENAGTGLISFSPADAGRTLTGTVLYYRKMHPTEV